MGEAGEGKMAAAWRCTPCQVLDCVQPWPHWKLHTDPVIRALVAHFTGAETETQWRENEPRITVNKWQKGLKLRAALNAKCISEMPASVETLPEQGTGMWAGLLRASWMWGVREWGSSLSPVARWLYSFRHVLSLLGTYVPSLGFSKAQDSTIK